MSGIFSVLNAAAVGIFGIVLAATLCNIRWDRRKNQIFLCGLVVLALLQIILFILLGESAVEKLYPLITHLPLTLILSYLSRQWLWSLLSVLISYLCCQLRRWIALLVVTILSGGDLSQTVAELVLTLPLLLIILRYVVPSVRELSTCKLSVQLQFGLIPAICYLFDYLTTVYTNWSVLDYPIAKEFMFFLLSAAYLIFVMRSTTDLRQQSELEQSQAVLKLQVRQSARQLQEMQHSQKMAAAYRHDLRHHLQYLASCLDNGEVQQAREYINSLHQDLTSQTVHTYCENTTVNLLLSAYADRAEQAGVAMTVQMRVGDEKLPITDNDLCVLLSNALENALIACADCLAAEQPAQLQINGYTREGKLFFQIVNSYVNPIKFHDGLPVTDQRGHGMGVRSICAIVEKYSGLCSFSASEKHFTLRCSI